MNEKSDCLGEFAGLCSALGNPQEAAIRMGINPKTAFKAGMRMMDAPEVRRKLAAKKKGVRIEALAGLRRLAFGRINDALALLREDADSIDFEGLDLFNVAEIKRPKGGGVEIKFFDRLSALERLAELEASEGSGKEADRLFSALAKSVSREEE